jgi:hypothetical protein
MASLAAAIFLCGCTARLVSRKVEDFSSPAGIPWVESREYEVFVYGRGRLLYFGRHRLGDTVNDVLIDDKRDRFELNYSSTPFSTANLLVELYENGALKKATLDGKDGSAAALSSVDEGLSLSDEMEKRELERLEREKKLRDAKKALEDE